MSPSPSQRLMSQEQIGDLLKANDILPTHQRLEIAQILFSSHQHWSADQVLQRVNKKAEQASKATVYNTLGLFAEKGIVREVIVDPSKVFYDPNTSTHHHFYNVDTSTLTDIDAAEISLGSLPTLPEGTEVEGVDVIIRVRGATQVGAE